MQWTILKAATEFGISRETLRKRLNAAEIPQAKDYSTKDICRAVFGDMDSEKLRLVREQADKLSLENATARRELVSGTELLPLLERGLAAIRATVYAASNLEREDKDKIINHLRQLWESVAGAVAPSGASPEPAAKLHSEPVE